MTSARLKLLVPALAGLFCVLLVLLALLRMVRAERDDAIEAARRHEVLVASFAQGELAARLKHSLARAQISMLATRSDPLQACVGCVFELAGRQVLPRLLAQGSQVKSVRYWAESLDAGRDGGDSMWKGRIALQRDCGDSDGSGRVTAFRSKYVLLPEQELASAFAQIEGCTLSPTQRAELLRGASPVPGSRLVEGGQQMLLRMAHKLSVEDAEYARARVMELSDHSKVGTRDFSNRWSELVDAPVIFPDNLPMPGIVSVGSLPYYVEAGGQQRSAIVIDLDAELSKVAEAMRDSALIDQEDRLYSEISASGQLLSTLAISLHSPRAQRSQGEIRDRYLVKLVLLGLCAVLIASLSAMALLLQRRRMRILELKSHFIAGVSHELKTPLASMRVVAETLSRRTKGMSVVRDYPDRLLRDIDGMVFVVENILSFNRLTKGRLVPKKEMMSLSEIVTRAVDEVQEHSDKRIELSVDDESLRGDPELLSLLFRNLIANSVAYNQNQVVSICVENSRTPRGLLLRLRDNGVGIADADRRHLFDDFYRGASAAMAPGSGLGLALSKRIVDLHKGKISVAETGNKGTSFEVLLP